MNKILLVDDEAAIRKIFKNLIEKSEPKWKVLTASTTEQGFEILEKNRDIAVVVADLMLNEQLNGLDFLSAVKESNGEITRILITGVHTSSDFLIEAINDDIIHRYIAKPISHQSLISIIRQGVERTNLIRSNIKLEKELFYKNKELIKLNKELNEKVKEQAGNLIEAYHDIINAFIAAQESRDPYTIGHSKKVAYYSTKIAEYLSLPKCKIFEIYLGSLLHDLGKLTIPDAILLKKGQLDNKETMIMRSHPEAGYKLINKIKIPWNIKDIILYHHEKWDGTGYPKKLKGEEIPLEVRIVSISDAMDAMLSDRVYRTAFSIEDVIEELKKNAGQQFDPFLVKKIVEMFNKKLISFVKVSPDINFMEKLYTIECFFKEESNYGRNKKDASVTG